MAHHPILNDQVLHHLAHGDLVHRPADRAVRRPRPCTSSTARARRSTRSSTPPAIQDRVAFVAEEHCRVSAVDERERPVPLDVPPAAPPLRGARTRQPRGRRVLGPRRRRRHDRRPPPRRGRPTPTRGSDSARSVIEGPSPTSAAATTTTRSPATSTTSTPRRSTTYAVELIEAFGFEPLAMPADFEPPELLDIDAWLDAPGPGRPTVGRLARDDPGTTRRI